MRIVFIDPTSHVSLVPGDLKALQSFLTTAGPQLLHVVSNIDSNESLIRECIPSALIDSWTTLENGTARKLAWEATQIAHARAADLIISVGWDYRLHLSGNAIWGARNVAFLIRGDVPHLDDNRMRARKSVIAESAALVCVPTHVRDATDFASLVPPGRLVDENGALRNAEGVAWCSLTGSSSAHWADVALVNSGQHAAIVAAAGALWVTPGSVTSIDGEDGRGARERDYAQASEVRSGCGAGVTEIRLANYGRDDSPKAVRRDAWNFLQFARIWKIKCLITDNAALTLYCSTHPDLAKYVAFFVRPQVVEDARDDPGSAAWRLVSSAVPLITATRSDLYDLERLIPESAPRTSSLDLSASGELEGLESYCARWGVIAPTTISKSALKVVVAGHDFKFAQHLIRSLFVDSRVELIVDHWPTQHGGGAVERGILLEWADVVWVEFASTAATWYSEHIGSGTRLIVRVHGYEVEGAWGDQIVFPAVSTVVFVSDHLQRAAQDRWPLFPDQCVVIPNSIDSEHFDRPKTPSAAFTVGMLGWLPALKRPDLALELLRELRARDPRFSLSMKGSFPTAASWFLDSSAEWALYASFAEDLRADEKIFEAVSFEQPGQDVAQWLSSVGWILSLSDRESFHLAAVEGMASGAVPVVLSREGATDIFPDSHVHETVESAADFIYHSIESGAFAGDSDDVRDVAKLFDVGQIRNHWLELLLESKVSK